MCNFLCYLNKWFSNFLTASHNLHVYVFCVRLYTLTCLYVFMHVLNILLKVIIKQEQSVQESSGHVVPFRRCIIKRKDLEDKLRRRSWGRPGQKQYDTEGPKPEGGRLPFKTWEGQDGWVVQPLRSPRFSPKCSNAGFPSSARSPGYPAPSSNLSGHQACMQHTDTHTGKTPHI